MFLSAFGRPANAKEIIETLDFAQEQKQRHMALSAEASEIQIGQRVWADVAHVLFNSAEFIYVR